MAFAQTLSPASAHGIGVAVSKQYRVSAFTRRCNQGRSLEERTNSFTRFKLEESRRSASLGRLQCRATTYTVEILHGGVNHVLQVPEDDTILSVALEEGLDVSFDCKLGVCMTCPAKLEKGNVDQSGGMLSDDVIERGYVLMCASYPLSDCTIRTIPEEELLSLQLATANDG